eukprot:XP_001706757.1 Hypothetical protein GL50803_37737 [Giardia lamblia ATCC 50803]
MLTINLNQRTTVMVLKSYQAFICAPSHGPNVCLNVRHTKTLQDVEPVPQRRNVEKI